MSVQVDFEQLLQEGCKLTVVSVSHLTDLQSEIERRREGREFEDEFAKEYLYRFKFALPVELKNARSIIVVAMPRPPTKAVFCWAGKKQAFILPPTYTSSDEKRLHVENLVKKAVGGAGFKIADLQLPLKLVAVRSGLAEYGRNNIAYVNGMGSFMRLAAVYSDMPCETDQWREAKMMNRCLNCGFCVKVCPTGALSEDRFLLHGEKCLTYHNEKEGKIPFPDWIKPEWHNCIIGCMRCQAACPENKPYLGQIGETVEFTEEETNLLLKGTPCDQMLAPTLEKCKLLSLTDYFNELPRNLSVLLKEAVKKSVGKTSS